MPKGLWDSNIDNLQALIFICFIMLKGEQGKDWDYYENQRALDIIVMISRN